MANAVPMTGLTHIQGIFNYLADTSKRPAYLVNPDRRKPLERPAQNQHTIPVYNGRKVQDQLSLDQQGLMLTKRETKVSDFYDAEEVKKVYYPEAAQLVKDMTGASKVVVFDHNVRCGPRSKQGEVGVSSPVLFAHNDYTIQSGPTRVRDLVPAEEAEELLKHRFCVINVWRPINVPAQDQPLAVCDASSIEQKDFIPTDLIFENRTGEIYSVAYNPEQRWFYFPSLAPGEAMLLKCYDSMDGWPGTLHRPLSLYRPHSPSQRPSP
jgi:hypothetical protein